MRTICVICTLIGVTNPLAPHTTPQSLWRTTQQINALDAHAQNYGPVLVACTARDFLRGCGGVEAFSTTEHGCDCVLESLNVSLVNVGDGTALLRAALDGPTKLALRTSQSKRPPRARFVDDGEAVFAGRGDDVIPEAAPLVKPAHDAARRRRAEKKPIRDARVRVTREQSRARRLRRLRADDELHAGAARGDGTGGGTGGTGPTEPPPRELGDLRPARRHEARHLRAVRDRGREGGGRRTRASRGRGRTPSRGVISAVSSRGVLSGLERLRGGGGGRVFSSPRLLLLRLVAP